MWMNRNLYQGDFCGALSVRAQFYRARGAQWDFRSVSAPVTPRLGSGNAGLYALPGDGG